MVLPPVVSMGGVMMDFAVFDSTSPHGIDSRHTGPSRQGVKSLPKLHQSPQGLEQKPTNAWWYSAAPRLKPAWHAQSRLREVLREPNRYSFSGDSPGGDSVALEPEN